MKNPAAKRITNRELDILRCLAEGLTTAETANKLYVSSDTVKTHRSNLLYKLDAKNAFQLGLRVVQYNLLALHQEKIGA